MEKKERAALIRKGNELFNNGELDEAIKIFEETNYIDGLIRVGDYYFYEKRLPLNALTYYRKAGRKEKVKEIYERMIYALGQWIGEDKIKEDSSPMRVKLPPLKVSPKLKILAQEILDREEGVQSPDA